LIDNAGPGVAKSLLRTGASCTTLASFIMLVSSILDSYNGGVGFVASLFMGTGDLASLWKEEAFKELFI